MKAIPGNSHGLSSEVSCQLVKQSFRVRHSRFNPLCPPTNMITSLEAARRRLYLTATLADDSVLVTHFGVSDNAAQDPITPNSAADIGDRLILSPRELNPLISDEHVRDLVSVLSEKYNVVVLVPSYRRADFWEESAALTVGAEKIAEAVEATQAESRGVGCLRQ